MDCYTEKHRILPGCMGGKYTKSNVVCLTPEEHYVAHQLLAKIYKNTEYHRRLIFAVHRMTNGRYRNNKLYGWIRRLHASAISEMNKGRNTWQIGKTWEEMYGPEKAEQMRQKRTKRQKGKTYEDMYGPEKAAELRNKRKGKTYEEIFGSAEGKRQREVRKGNRNGAKNKGQAAWNKGLKITHRTSTCVYCGITCSVANLSRWHGDRCKHKNTMPKHLDAHLQ